MEPPDQTAAACTPMYHRIHREDERVEQQLLYYACVDHFGRNLGCIIEGPYGPNEQTVCCNSYTFRAYTCIRTSKKNTQLTVNLAGRHKRLEGTSLRFNLVARDLRI